MEDISKIKSCLSIIINKLKKNIKCQAEFKKYNATLICKENYRDEYTICFKIISGNNQACFHLRDWLRIVAIELEKQLKVDVDWGKYSDDPDGCIEISFLIYKYLHSF